MSTFYNFVIKPDFRGIDLGPQNIMALKVFSFTSIAVLLLMPVGWWYTFKKKQATVKQTMKEYVYYLVLSVITLIELVVGVYATTVLFEFKYTGFDPRLTFVLACIILIMIFEKIKTILIARMTVSD